MLRALTLTCPLLISGVVSLLGCADVPSAAIPSCEGGRAEPISTQRLRQTLRQHSFTVEPVGRDATCGAGDGPKTLAVLSNVRFDGPFENLDQSDEITEREGMIICGVRSHPFPGQRNTLGKDLDAPPASPIFNGKKAEFFLANVECAVYPQGGRSGQQVANLDQAMSELEGSLRGAVGT
jgi:hypothetical protein